MKRHFAFYLWIATNLLTQILAMTHPLTPSAKEGEFLGLPHANVERKKSLPLREGLGRGCRNDNQKPKFLLANQNLLYKEDMMKKFIITLTLSVFCASALLTQAFAAPQNTRQGGGGLQLNA